MVGVPTKVGRRASLDWQAVGYAGSKIWLSYQPRLVKVLVRSGSPYFNQNLHWDKSLSVASFNHLIRKVIFMSFWHSDDSVKVNS